MADSFYTAWAEVAPDFSGFGRKVDKGFRDSMGPAGDRAGRDAGKGISTGVLGAVKRLAAPLTAAFGAFRLGKLIGDSIRQANDLEQTTAAVDVVFGKASATIRGFAKDAVQSLGITEQQALEASQMFGVFGKAAGLSGNDLSGFSNDLATLGADLAAFYGGDIQTALNAIGAGLRGESEPLRQFGVLLDDATLKARAMAMGIYDGTGSLTQQQRVLAAQAEILAQTTDAQGAAAREAESFDGQLKRLQAGWESLVTTLGTVFLPIATTIVSFLNTNVLPAVKGVIDILFNGDYTGGLFAAMGATEDSGIVDFLFTIREAFQALIGGDWSTLFAIFTEVRNSLITNIVEALPGIVTAVAGFLPTLIGELANSFISLVATLVGLAGTIIPQIVTALSGAIPQLVGALLAAVPTLLTAALAVFQQLVVAVITILPVVVSTLLGLLPQLASTILGMLPDIIAAAIGLFTGIIEALVTIIPMLIQTLIELLPVLLTTILGMLPDIIAAAIDLFFGLVMALLQVLPDLIRTLVGDVLPNLIVTIIRMLPDIIKAAVTVFKGLITGLSQNLPEIIRFIITDMIPAIVDAIIGAVPELIEAGVALIQGLIDGVMSMFGAIGDAFGGVMDFIGGFFPHSPAERGPFSGAGWRAVGQSGKALYDQFMSGFDGDDPTFPEFPPPRPLTLPRVPAPTPDEFDKSGGDALGPAMAVFYDVDGVLIGSIRGEVARADAAQARRARGRTPTI